MDNKKILEFAKMAGKLKRIPRTGWKNIKIKSPESVADHSFRTTLLGMLFSDLEGYNTGKIMKMLIIHDIEESITGDISSVKKNESDKINGMKAAKKIFDLLPKKIGKEYLKLWFEIENGETKEAKFCKDLDKLEMMIQALEYEKIDKNAKGNLKSFWEKEFLNAPRNYPLFIKLYEHLKKERKKL